MRVWFDTEFIDDGRTIDLISIGMIRDDGLAYYAQNKATDLNKAGDWVKTNVFPHLDTGPQAWIRPRQIAREIVQFAGDDPEWWAYFGAYDWVALCQLYGPMVELPPHWPQFYNEVRTLPCFDAAMAHKKAGPTAHNALADARWAREFWTLAKNLEFGT